MTAVFANSRPSLKTPTLPRPQEEARVAATCRRRGMPEPILRYQVAPGVRAVAVWEGEEVALLLTTGNAARDARRVNLGAIEGGRVLLVTARQWTSGEALRMVRRAL